MESQIYHFATLSLVDAELDEFQDEYGDLPERVKTIKRRLAELKSILSESESILQNIKDFSIKSKTTLVDLKDKEEKLSKQQFLVRNNKEFDAITKEIEHIRGDHNKLVDELRIAGVKEENLLKTIEQQKLDVAEVQAELKEKAHELEAITSDQNDEVKGLYRKREEIIKDITEENIIVYDRIRGHHLDAVVGLRKNSCSGCYSSVPPQKIVEIRNNLNHLFTCEQCGRILYPEDMVVDSPL